MCPIEGENLSIVGRDVGHRGVSRVAARGGGGVGLQHTGNASAVGRELEHALERLGLAGRRILVAVSGGVDSTVLAHGLASCRDSHGVEVALGHVHHGLRGAEADGDERAVAELARALGLDFAQRRVDPQALREGRSSRDRPTLQEAARALRYAALAELCEEQGAACIATAHHADDQLETVLLRLLRGTGPDGLAGIPERSLDGRIVRPLLFVARDEIEAYARASGLSWREDSSNAEVRYARNRLRQRWLPGLASDFNPRLLRAVGDLAEAQARDSEWIAERVAAESSRRFAVEGPWLRIDTKDFSALPEALARRVVRAALTRCDGGRHVSRVHLERMLRFLRNARRGTRIELPGGRVLRLDSEGFRLGPLSLDPSDGPPSPC
jgi:tRNA(Ile)-lysidine synthase